MVLRCSIEFLTVGTRTSAFVPALQRLIRNWEPGVAKGAAAKKAEQKVTERREKENMEKMQKRAREREPDESSCDSCGGPPPVRRVEPASRRAPAEKTGGTTDGPKRTAARQREAAARPAPAPNPTAPKRARKAL